MKHLFRSVALALVSTAVLGLLGCDAPTDLQRLAQARQLLTQNNGAAAALELKALLQANPDSGEGRLLLGKALLATGSPAAAEIELTRALAQGRPNDEVLPELAESLLAQRKWAELLRQYASVRLDAAGPAATFLAYLAEARAIEGSLPDANRLVAEALKAQPDHVPARLLEARLRAASGDTATAMKLLDALLARGAGNADVLVFKAELLRAMGADVSGQMEMYRKALASWPDAAAAHVGLLTLLVQRGEFDAARTQQLAMAKALPRHPKAVFFDALLAHQRGDHARAVDLTQYLLKTSPQDPLVLLLAGQSALQAGALAQAEAALGKVVNLMPDAAAPRRMLAQAQLRAGHADQALATLKPLTTAAIADPDALLLAAQAAQQKGDAVSAERLYARASQLRPADDRIKLARTVAQFGKGRDDAALADLLRLADADKSGTDALSAAISAHLARQDYGAALKAVDSLAARQPASPGPDDLRGRIAMRRQQLPDARRHFEQALLKDPDYYPSIAMLVAMDMAEKKPALALSRLDALLQRQPKRLEAMLTQIEIKAQGGASADDVRAMLGAVVRAHPNNPVAHALQIDYLLASGKTTQALTSAQAAVAALPDQVDLLDRWGRAQVASGQLFQAEAAFQRLSELQPERAQPHLRLAEVQLQRNQPDAARANIGRARKLEPANLDALRAELAMALRDKRPADAMTLARQVQSLRPADPMGLALEGDVASHQQQWAAAERAYRQALTMAPKSSAMMQRLHASLLEGGNTVEAAAAAARWQADQPDDIDFLHYLAAAALGRKDWDLSDATYRNLLSRNSDDLVALNNLALVLHKQRKPGALELAEKAATLAPAQPNVLDTLAQVYAADKQVDKAVATQRKAVDNAPDAGGLRLHLARLYLQVNDKDRARDELAKLAKLGQAFSGQDEVARLQRLVGLAQADSTLRPREGARSTGLGPWATPKTIATAKAAAMAGGALVLLAVPLALLLAALRPPQFQVRRAVSINAPLPRVFALMDDLHQWQRWSLWRQFDPAVKRSFLRGQSSPGAVCNWQDERRAAEGTVQIIHAVAPSQLAVELSIAKPDVYRQWYDFSLAADSAGGTVVTCLSRGEAPFSVRLANVLRGVDHRIGKDLLADLARLKSTAEVTAEVTAEATGETGSVPDVLAGGVRA